ncbi:MAG TPA: NAD(P)/FAD-dependent oxidoreductase, partial [Cyanothece sp. UBA12306]|nr:NAD(P)/FAD-dependent oxidoreductase [Cyanothece sp. UBA12306]
EDPQITHLLQGQLEAEGIAIFTNSPLTQVKIINNRKWVQAGNQVMEADEIILVMQRKPNIQGLNLEGVKIAVNSGQIKVNSKLQTTNSQIYAFGGVLGVYHYPNIAQYQASIIIKNCLFFSYFKANYDTIPYTIFTNPPLTRIGLTEFQAKRRYGNDVIVIQDYFKTLSKAQILGETTGFCQIITRRNGKILGCHCLGIEAEELIGAIALAMQNNLKIQDLALIFPPSPSLFEVLSRISQTWKSQKFERNKWLNQWLERLLFWRRKWS